MNNYTLIFFLLFTSTFSVVAQNKSVAPQSLIINVLIDAKSNVYIEETQSSQNSIKSNVQKIVDNSPAFKYEGVTYRIFADGSLQHGTIMDVSQLLLNTYKPLQTSVEKYLLDTKANNLDGPDWVQQLNSFDLKDFKIN